MTEQIDDYIARSTQWPDELQVVRQALISAGLTEEFKWRKPCYSYEGRNIVILQEMKAFLAVMFFEGARLDDPAGVLEAQGPNSQSARRVCIRSVDDASRLVPTIRTLVDSAIALGDAPAVPKPTAAWTPVDALQERLDSDATFRNAFTALTPGRQREYHLHISSAKQLDTRRARVEKLAPQILAGKGMRDR
jgi:uncharacterized protein YdeI (YjbR/CyaY-like superfamily)